MVYLKTDTNLAVYVNYNYHYFVHILYQFWSQNPKNLTLLIALLVILLLYSCILTDFEHPNIGNYSCLPENVKNSYLPADSFYLITHRRV